MSHEIPLQLYDTEKRSKEILTPSDGKTVRMYTCGPTVYNFAHIGNLRTYIFEDLLRRTIKFFGFSLKHVMNLTDVEDKTIKASQENNQPLDTYTRTYKEAFFEDLKTLHIEPAEVYPSAVDHVPEMIAMIQTLIDKNHAYRGVDGNVFFRIDSFPSYGRLSHLHIEDLQVGASNRTAADEYDKEKLSDFVLWKAYDPERDGDVFWESPFGKGRPGWHIECSAMATKHLGPSIDIHCGGVDNIFPHHENEIAQSEACTERHFVNHWVHSEHLIVDGKKMSKSLGNFYTLRDLLDKGYSGEQIRYLLLSTHYRTQLNFTLEGLDAAKHALDRLEAFVHRLRSIDTSQSARSIQPLISDCEETFRKALGDDLNISAALAALFDFIREINSHIDEKALGKDSAEQILAFLAHLNSVLAVIPLEEKALEIPADIEEAFEKRNQARKDRDWATADSCRDFIHARGFMIEDSPSGPRLKPK